MGWGFYIKLKKFFKKEDAIIDTDIHETYWQKRRKFGDPVEDVGLDRDEYKKRLKNVVNRKLTVSFYESYKERIVTNSIVVHKNEFDHRNFVLYVTCGSECDYRPLGELHLTIKEGEKQTHYIVYSDYSENIDFGKEVRFMWTKPETFPKITKTKDIIITIHGLSDAIIPKQYFIEHLKNNNASLDLYKFMGYYTLPDNDEDDDVFESDNKSNSNILKYVKMEISKYTPKFEKNEEIQQRLLKPILNNPNYKEQDDLTHSDDVLRLGLRTNQF